VGAGRRPRPRAEISSPAGDRVTPLQRTTAAAARHEVLRRVGWDVEAHCLAGAPPIRVIAGADRHDSIDRALRFLGVGTDAIIAIPADDQGRMDAEELAAVLAGHTGPAIVCAQVGNFNPRGRGRRRGRRRGDPETRRRPGRPGQTPAPTYGLVGSPRMLGSRTTAWARLLSR
jgi:hypothetical protein